MKKEKLNLKGLKVQSFVTANDKAANKELKGGTAIWFCEPTDPDPCGTTGCTRWTDCRCGGGGSNGCGGGGQSMDISGPCAC